MDNTRHSEWQVAVVRAQAAGVVSAETAARMVSPEWGKRCEPGDVGAVAAVVTHAVNHPR